MKNKDLKYIKAPVLTESMGVLVLLSQAINRLMKREKIADTLEKIVEQSQENAEKFKNFSNAQKNSLLDEYRDSNNFFAVHFRKYEEASIEERLEYCLLKYKEEISNLYTASNTIVLNENFLKGAERTLAIYYAVVEPKINEELKLEKTHKLKDTEKLKEEIRLLLEEQKNKEEQKIKELSKTEEFLNLESIFINLDDYNKFLQLLETLELKLRPSSGNLKKSVYAFILNELRNLEVIRAVSDAELIHLLNTSLCNLPLASYIQN